MSEEEYYVFVGGGDLVHITRGFRDVHTLCNLGGEFYSAAPPATCKTCLRILAKETKDE